MDATLASNPHAHCPVTDAQALSALYDNNSDPRNQADLRALHAASAAAFADLATRKSSQRFGAAAWQSFDVFRPVQRAVGALVFVHGGRWQVNTSRETAFWAEACCDAGMVFIGLNFPKRAEAALPAQVDAVAQAIAAALAFTAGLDIAPRKVCVAGHSSGAHLALAALLHRPVEAGALLLLGGLYDLRPMARTSHQETLRFTEDEVQQCSPLLSLCGEVGRTLPATLVAVGAQESSEFIRQSRALHWALQSRTQASWHLVPDSAHFDAALEFNAPQSVLRHFTLHHEH